MSVNIDDEIQHKNSLSCVAIPTDVINRALNCRTRKWRNKLQGWKMEEQITCMQLCIFQSCNLVHHFPILQLVCHLPAHNLVHHFLALQFAVIFQDQYLQLPHNQREASVFSTNIHTQISAQQLDRLTSDGSSADTISPRPSQTSV